MIKGEREGVCLTKTEANKIFLSERNNETLRNDPFLQSEIVLKQKAGNIYLLYIFVITTAFIHIHGFSLNLSPVVSLFHITVFYRRCFINLY